MSSNVHCSAPPPQSTSAESSLTPSLGTQSRRVGPDGRIRPNLTLTCGYRYVRDMSGRMATWATVYNGLQMSVKQDVRSPSRLSADELQENEDELHV